MPEENMTLMPVNLVDGNLTISKYVCSSLRKYRSFKEYTDVEDDLHKARNVLDEEGEEIAEDAKAKTEHSDKSNVHQIMNLTTLKSWWLVRQKVDPYSRA